MWLLIDDNLWLDSVGVGQAHPYLKNSEETPSLDERMCRNCPKTDDLKKKD